MSVSRFPFPPSPQRTLRVADNAASASPSKMGAAVEARRSDWAAATMRAITFGEQHNARILGITSDRHDGQAFALAEAIAAQYVSFGRRPLLLDLTSLDSNAEASPEYGRDRPDLLASTRSQGCLAIVDGATVGWSGLSRREDVLEALKAAQGRYDAFVIALPSVVPSEGKAVGLRAAATACDAVFLLCKTARITRDELDKCLLNCSMKGIKLAGLFLDDSELEFNAVLRAATWRNPWRSTSDPA